MPTIVADVVGRTLATLGVGHCFGVVGSGNFQVTNALRANGVPFTATRHEGGAATMADAYARMSGQVALLSVHQGCGLTNAATGICEAAKSRTPLVVLAAEAGGATSNFAMDQPGYARSLGAVAERVHSGESAVEDTVRAWRTARDERRTVVLNLPLSVQALAASAIDVSAAPRLAQVVPSADDVAALADLFRQARRPVIVAGRGAREAGPALRRLGEVTGSLLATSAVANGLFHGDPYALGISGGFASPTVARLISEADLIVGFGCALNMWTMRHGRLIGADAKVVQVDVDGAALGVHRPIDLGVVGDSGATASAVLSLFADARLGYRGAEVADSIARRGRWNDEPTDDLSTADRIDSRVLSRALDTMLPAERIVSIDSGNFMGYPSAYLGVPDEFGFCFTQAFQSIGLGLATAIGAALARPDRLPVLAAGDGGFLMSVAELETAVRLGIPLLCVVYNDAAYGAEVHHFGADADLGAVTFPDTDIAALATGFGARGLTVRTAADLGGITEWLAAPTGPLVVDAKIVSDGGSWWLAEAFKGH
ncbi:acetolactate synthase I/II/III large subunit [Asanoa ishikariensis]|uniref:Acetolactate synthase large subunit n=1 Tax=Asanoa ishikariensis TaxID=137265 RepID=A0A1H3PHX3_9ACTN|nr:thiamine pyrophosphate-binding protein [Asanoa ishikariensis]GIF67800.1 acetolactate synthase I/II/III large subunit [Asanoa ishikariensis]SDZ00543.1 Acetolactate synthase large subunit [Asanoa ishikariensis]